MLSTRNGFVAFESALHVFPLGGDAACTLAMWNREDGWKSAYGDLVPEAYCFAQDSFAFQFCLVREEVMRFDPEQGALESMADSLEEWAAILLLDYDAALGWSSARDWQLTNRPLNVGERLLTRKPFVLGGENSSENLRVMDAEQALRRLGRLAQWLHGIADSTPVRLVNY